MPRMYLRLLQFSPPDRQFGGTALDLWGPGKMIHRDYYLQTIVLTS